MVAIAPAYIVHSVCHKRFAADAGRSAPRPPATFLNLVHAWKLAELLAPSPRAPWRAVDTKRKPGTIYTLLGTHYKNTRGILGVYCPYTQLVSTTRIIIGFVMRHAVKKNALTPEFAAQS